MEDNFKEICKNCGFTSGSHCGGAYYSEFYNMSVPLNYCPGHEGRMDWDKGPGTVFEPTGRYKEGKMSELLLLSEYLKFVSNRIKDTEDNDDVEEFSRLVDLIIDTLCETKRRIEDANTLPSNS